MNWKEKTIWLAENKKNYSFSKYIYFFMGFFVLAAAEILVRYSGTSWSHTTVYYMMPILISPLFYFILIRTFKYENLS